MARARSFGNIRKLPSGRYQARYWHLGKQVAADTTFANKTDARRWLATVEANPAAGAIPWVWKRGSRLRVPSLCRALCPSAIRSPHSFAGMSVKVASIPSGSRIWFWTRSW